MDVKDQKIVSLLLDNSRTSFTQLAKKVGVSKEVLNYRIKRLEKQLINGYYTIINNEALGFKRYLFFIQLKQISPREEDEFLDYLNHHPYVTYLGPIIGKWNLVFDLLVRDENHLRELAQEIVTKAGPYFESYIINGTAMHEEIFHTKFFPLSDVHVSQQHQPKTTYRVDEIDKKILSILANNARAEYAYLANELGMTANAIKYRIKKLEKENIILGYTTSVRFNHFGYELYNLQVKLSTLDRNKFLTFLRSHKQVWFLYNYLGHEQWDVDIGLFVKSSKDIRKFIIELKELFGEHIQLHDMYIIADVTKDNVAPAGLFE
jgi:Lrp/AsnC family transcriptional regulator, regulator for asnA, asnC and gidA